MPILSIDLSTTPGFLIQRCANCGLEHTIRFNRGAVETKPGPFSLAAGKTLEVALDGKAAVVLPLAAADAVDLAKTSIKELAAKLATIPGIELGLTSAGTVLIESATTGAGSRVEIGGSARAALGLLDNGMADPCPGRPVLGVPRTGGKNPDAIALRRCGCGANEVLMRTWDKAPKETGAERYQHRDAVNFLATRFIAEKWLHADAADVIEAEKDLPPDRFPAETKLVKISSVLSA